MKELWRVLRGPRCNEILGPLAFQTALAQQFAAWMVVSGLVVVPPALVMIGIAIWRASR